MRVRRGAKSNKFCGPAALSLLTGKHVDDCIAEINASRGYDGFLKGYRKRPVRSVDKHEITRVLTRMGFLLDTVFHSDVSGYGRFERGKKPTLVALMRWLKRQEHWSPKRKYLVLVTGHYVVMKGIKLFDNAHPEGVFFGKYGKRRRRVWQVWEVTKREIRPTSRPVPSGSSRRLAASS